MPGQTYADVLGQSISQLLQSQASDAIIATMVHYSIDDAIRSKAEISAMWQVFCSESWMQSKAA